MMLTYHSGSNSLKESATQPSSFISEIQEGHFESVRDLIRQGANVNQVTDGGVTPLMAAAIKCHYQTMELLLENGADIHAKDNYGYNTLMKVIIENTSYFEKMNVIGLLEKFGAKPSADDQNHQLPIALLRAAQANHWRIVELLLQVGVDPNFGEFGASALKIAVQRENVPMIARLLAAGANIHEVDVIGRTLLWMGIETGNADVVSALLKGGANPLQSVRGVTPLCQAIDSQNQPMAILLVAAIEDLEKLKSETHKSQSSPLIFTLAREVDRLSTQSGLKKSSKKN